MLWSIDIELDELVAESKSGEATSGNEHQKDGEKDKQVVAELVRKLLVCQVLNPSPVALNTSPAGRRDHSIRSL